MSAEEKYEEFFKALGIPTAFTGLYIRTEFIYDIFTDEKKLKELISRLNNRMFW